MSTNSKLIARALRLLGRCAFPGYSFTVTMAHGGVVMRGSYPEHCAITGRIEMQHTRKWLLSPNMTNSEIVFTAFKMCLTSMEHRTREFFTYRDQRIASPHFDVEDLVRICAAGSADAGARATPQDGGTAG